MSSQDIDVLIVGAGPVGLVAALALAQSGVSVRVVDKATSTLDVGQRGAGITPRSQEAYMFLGCLDDFLKQAGPVPKLMRFFDPKGNVMKEFPFLTQGEKTPEIPIPNTIALGQDSNCAILCKHLEALGTKVELNTELVTFEQDDAGVDVTIKAGEQEEKIRSKFLLGTDGAKGITRRIAGINFVGKTHDHRSIIGDIELSGLGDENVLYNFADEKKNRLMIRPVPEDPTLHFIVLGGPVITEQGVAALDHDSIQEQIRRLSNKPDLTLVKIRKIADWRLNERVADKFQVGRVLIAGDAAHCHSPAGGQGLNSGVMDAMNAAWKLALVSKGFAPLALLDSYEQERVPVIREMLRMTSTILSASMQAANGQGDWNRPLSLRQLGIHCRWSPIVRDEMREGELVLTSTNVEPEDVYGTNTPEGLRAGDRAPDAPELANVETGEHVQLFKLFSATRHTVLVFDAAATGDVRSLVSAYPESTVGVVTVLAHGNEETKLNGDSYIDTQGHAHRAYGAASGVKIVVVRPDGVVGGLLKGVEGVKQYFSRVLV